jgi:hypothetical protein
MEIEGSPAKMAKKVNFRPEIPENLMRAPPESFAVPVRSTRSASAKKKGKKAATRGRLSKAEELKNQVSKAEKLVHDWFKEIKAAIADKDGDGNFGPNLTAKISECKDRDSSKSLISYLYKQTMA